MGNKVKGIMIVTLIGIFGFAALSYAGWGYGCGNGAGFNSRGPGWQRGGGYGYGMRGSLTEEEVARFNQQRAEYFKATEDIRRQLNEKDLALRAELAKEAPDKAKASALQSEISNLQGQLDQVRLDFNLQNKNAGVGCPRGYGGRGPGMGYGPRGGGYCWR